MNAEQLKTLKLPESVLTTSQKKKLPMQRVDGPDKYFHATIRYDDSCGNGHNSFAITGETKFSGGCLHEDFARYHPELAHLLKWHLCSSDGPMHYVANTLYHADEHAANKAFLYSKEKKLNGIKLEAKCLKYGGVEELAEIANLLPDDYAVLIDTKTAKQADLEAARRSAIWPDATLEQLRDEKQLLARLPKLMEAFKADIEAIGFTY